ncbi:MAG TPA: hypothetical protein VFE58_05705 [Tepidisphaeraceae bacterium]|jgi:hypothetical protein|nr:hypothetical protein [Tepidisphaeraceae bacterium]
MIWGQLLGVLLLFGIMSWAPGLLLVRRLRWRADERVCAAIAASLLIIYLCGMIVFLAGLGHWAYWVIAGGCLAAAISGARDAAGLLRLSSVRRMLCFYLALAAWSILCLGIIRHYAGGLWCGDWIEHYHKAQMFLNGGPANQQELRDQFLDRPPMANVVATCVLGVLGDRFEVFQLFFTLLNMLAVLPCCLMAGRMARRGGRRMWVLWGMMICLPPLWINATYTWTKLSATFYVILAIWLYLRAIEKRDRGRMLAAWTSFAAGALVHYVSVPYALVTIAHYLVFVWRGRRQKWRELAQIIACGVGVLMTWFGLMTIRYGMVFWGANPTLRNSANNTAGQIVMKMARNVVWTLVPHPLRMSSGVYGQRSTVGWVRDYLFLIYQANTIFIIGSVTAFVAGWIAYQRLRATADRRGWIFAGGVIIGIVGFAYVPGASDVLFDLFRRWLVFVLALAGMGFLAKLFWDALQDRKKASAEVWYWRMLIVLMPVMAGIVHDLPSDYGIGQMYFLPWALMAVTLVAANVGKMSAVVRWCLGIGLLVDFTLGIWLHLVLEHRIFKLAADGWGVDTGGLTLAAGLNWRDKVKGGYVYIGDLLPAAGTALEIILAIGGIVAVGIVVRGNRAGRPKRNLDRGVVEPTIAG